MICIYRDVVFPIKVLVPLIHARDNAKTLFLNLSVIRLGVVQPVRCETARHRLHLQTRPLGALKEKKDRRSVAQSLMQ